MRIIFGEQDLINAVCGFMAVEHGGEPGHFVAELFFNDLDGFFAESNRRGEFHRHGLSQQDMIDAVALYLGHRHNFNPNNLFIELFFDTYEGFSAVIDER